jgi:hypothetical protein
MRRIASTSIESLARRTRRLAAACSVIAAALALARPARADDADTKRDASASSWHPRLVGDVREMQLWRDDNNYLRHAQLWGYDVPREADGVQLTLGVAELAPRLSLVAEGFYVGSGADRGTAKLRLSSGAVLAVARFAVARTNSKHIGAELSAVAGAGQYLIRETFVDPNLSAMVFAQSDARWGGFGGAEASVHGHSFRVMLAYAYHYGPATIGDRIRGTIDAGGHELSFGIGVRL